MTFSLNVYVLQETCAECFKKKDFVSLLRNHPEPKQVLKSDSHMEVEDIIGMLVSKNLLLRSGVVVKRVHTAFFGKRLAANAISTRTQFIPVGVFNLVVRV